MCSYENVRIETTDLLLKKAVQDDWKDMYENLWQYKESAKYMLWNVTTSEADAFSRMERTVEFEKKEKYALLVYEKRTGKAIGFAGMRELEPGVFEESGIAIGPAFTGKGYGKQILNTAMRQNFVPAAAKQILHPIIYRCRVVLLSPMKKIRLTRGMIRHM